MKPVLRTAKKPDQALSTQFGGLSAVLTLLVVLTAVSVSADTVTADSSQAVLLKVADSFLPSPAEPEWTVFLARYGGGRFSRVFQGPTGTVVLPSDLKQWWRLELAPGVDPELTARNALELPLVMVAEPDGVVEASPYLGGDPLEGQQWGLWVIGALDLQPEDPERYPLVAVLDTGIDALHPDLRRSVLDHGAVDTNGHGTLVAGVIAAESGNELGGRGVVPRAPILSIQVLDAQGRGHFSSLATGLVEAIIAGARVINMSLASPSSSALVSEVIDFATSANAVMVSSAGNDGRLVEMFPASHPDVIAVGATDVFDNVADFSNRAAHIDLVAPGSGILSTTRGGGYELFAGTSAATAFVSGAAAALLARYPMATPAAVASILRASALDVPPPGEDFASGAGRLSLGEALDVAAKREGGSAGLNVVPEVVADVVLGDVLESTSTMPCGLWEPVPVNPASTLSSVIYAEGRFLAVGGSSVMTSLDGSSWSVLASGIGYSLNEVIFTGTEYLALTADALVASPTGEVWTERATFDTFSALGGIAWNGTRLVVAGNKIRGAYTELQIWSSLDGAVWTLQYEGPSRSRPGAAVWLGGQFLVGGQNGSLVTSPDGLAWTFRTTGATGMITDIAWNGSTYVAPLGNTVLMSPDGVSWSEQAAVAAGTAVEWFGSRFVAVGGQFIHSSPDGVDWVEEGRGAVWTFQFLDLAWSGSLGVAVGTRNLAYRNQCSEPEAGFRVTPQAPLENELVTFEDTSGVMPTSWFWDFGDGQTSTEQNPTHRYLDSGSYVVSLTVSNAAGSDSTTQVVSVSAIIPGCGIWEPVPVNPASTLSSVIYAEGRFLAVGGSSVMTSLDGSSWSVLASGIGYSLNEVIFTGTEYLALTADALLASPTGEVWTERATFDTFSALGGIAWNGTRLVVAGNKIRGAYTELQIWSSLDTAVWTLQYEGPSRSRPGAAVWLGGQFLVGGQNGSLVTSPDGLAWTFRTTGATGMITDIAWNGSTYVAPLGNTVLMSPDGVSWSEQAAVAAGTAVEWFGSRFVVVGGQFIHSSPDGVDWVEEGRGAVWTFQFLDLAWSGSLGVAVGTRNLAYRNQCSEPEAGFRVTPQAPLENELVTFEDTSGVMPTSWFWDFGDGQTSTEQNPTHRYLDSGSYVVSLTVSNAAGSDSTTQVVSVSAIIPGCGIWEPVPVNPASTLSSVIYAEGRFLAVGGSSVMTSLDGSSWSVLASGIGYSLNEVIFTGTEYLALTADALLASPTGEVWTERATFDTFSALGGIAWNGTRLVVAGNKIRGAYTELQIWSSLDTAVWTLQYEGPSHSRPGAAVWLGGQFLVGGQNGSLVTSPDGLAWTFRTTGATGMITDIAWNGSTYVAPLGNTVLMSPDGVSWSEQAAVAGGAAVEWFGSRFVAVGGQFIHSSPDGVDWVEEGRGDAWPFQFVDVAWSGTQGVTVGAQASGWRTDCILGQTDPGAIVFAPISEQNVGQPFDVSLTLQDRFGRIIDSSERVFIIGSLGGLTPVAADLEGGAASFEARIDVSGKNQVLRAAVGMAQGSSSPFDVLSPSSPTSTVGGRVQDNSTGAGVAGVEVTLDPATPDQESVATQNDGSYAFSQVGCGWHEIRVQFGTYEVLDDVVIVCPSDGIHPLRAFPAVKDFSVPDGTCDLSRPPILLLPGILGSATEGHGLFGHMPVLPARRLDGPRDPAWGGKWSYEEHAAQGLHDPLGRVGWLELVRTLEASDSGYGLGCNIFPVPYDWRRPVKEISRRFLEPAIALAKARTGQPRVAIVAHSMGGLVARELIEQGDGAQDVAQLILVGTPNEGNALAYFLWQGGDPVTADLLQDGSFFLEDLYTATLEELWEEYHPGRSPGEKAFNSPYVDREWFENIAGFIRREVPSLQDLLPTEDFLLRSEALPPAPLECGAGWENLWLKALNSSLLSGRGDIAYYSASPSTDKVHLTILYGQEESRTLGRLSVSQNDQGCTFPFYPDGIPDAVFSRVDPPPSNLAEGDGTVAVDSAEGPFLDLDPIVADLRPGSGSHGTLVLERVEEICLVLLNAPPGACTSPAEGRRVAVSSDSFSLEASVAGAQRLYLEAADGAAVGIEPVTFADRRDFPNSGIVTEVTGSRIYGRSLSLGQYVLTVHGASGTQYSLQVSIETGGAATRRVVRSFSNGEDVYELLVSAGGQFELGRRPEPPAGLIALLAPGGVTDLAWDYEAETPVEEFRVYSMLASDRSMSLVGSTGALSFATTHTWAVAPGDDVRYYAISAVDSAGVESILSGGTKNDDRDYDGLSDAEEEELGTDLENPDSDGDGLADGEEVLLGTDPLNSDSDGDGFSDLVEVLAGTDPLDEESAPQNLLSVTVAGTGGGHVSSQPSGIQCGADCFQEFEAGTEVLLAAVPDGSSLFLGWGSDPDCLDGGVIAMGFKSCVANFGRAFSLAVDFEGDGTGLVTTDPAGISCSSECSGLFLEGQTVQLQAESDASSGFVVWTGEEDCWDGEVSMNSSRSCGAAFAILGACGHPETIALNARVISTAENYLACGSITLGPDLRVSPVGSASFLAGDFVELLDGFSVELGGELVVGESP